jgi:hypothetical protein
MMWYHYVAHFFGGLVFANSIPHLVAGAMGRPFQSPFAKPPGQGLSSSRVNVLWGGLNLVVAYLLLWHVGTFTVGNYMHAAVAGLPGLALTLMHATRFGRFNGGDRPLAVQRENEARPCLVDRA